LKTKKNSKDEDCYAPNIEEKSGKKKSSHQNVPMKKSSERIIQKCQGNYGVFFVFQILFLWVCLTSFQIDHYSLPEIQLFLHIIIFGSLLLLGIILVIFGHRWNQITMFFAIFVLYSTWLFSLLRNKSWNKKIVPLATGEIIGAIAGILIIKFQNRLEEFTGFVCGALSSMLMAQIIKPKSLEKLRFSIIIAILGGIFGIFLVIFIKRKTKGIVLSTTFLGLFLMKISVSMLAGGRFESDFLSEFLKSYFWVYVFGILRQVDFTIFKKKKKQSKKKN